MPKLVFHDSDGVDKTLQLGTEPVLIGRASDCQVQTHDAMVSRKHARITWDGGAYQIEDLGSSNGVFLGQDKVQRAAFRPGDIVTCGSLVLRMVPEPRRSQPGTEAFDPPPPRQPPIEVRAPEPRRAEPPPTEEGPRPEPVSDVRLRAELQTEQQRRLQAEDALLRAEERVHAAEEAQQELVGLRRRVEQLQGELRRAQDEAPPPLPPAPDGGVDLDEVGESVALFNDALAELKSSLRAAHDEAQLLSAPAPSVRVVRDSLRAALEELDRARMRLREMVRTIGLPDA